MKRQIDKLLPGRLQTEASKRLEQYITNTEQESEVSLAETDGSLQGKVNINVNNRNKVRLTEKVLNINQQAINTLQEIIQFNGKLMGDLDKGANVSITNSHIETTGEPAFYIKTEQDNTDRENHEYELSDAKDFWVDQ